jgi:hypothetical protein
MQPCLLVSCQCCAANPTYLLFNVVADVVVIRILFLQDFVATMWHQLKQQHGTTPAEDDTTLAAQLLRLRYVNISMWCRTSCAVWQSFSG